MWRPAARGITTSSTAFLMYMAPASTLATNGTDPCWSPQHEWMKSTPPQQKKKTKKFLLYLLTLFSVNQPSFSQGCVHPVPGIMNLISIESAEPLLSETVAIFSIVWTAHLHFPSPPHNRYNMHSKSSTGSPSSLPLHSASLSEHLRYLTSSTCRRNSSPTQNGHSPLSGWEPWPHFEGASYLSKHFTLGYKCKLDDKTKNSHINCEEQRGDSEATKAEILCHFAMLEILSLKIMKRTGDKGKPCQFNSHQE